MKQIQLGCGSAKMGLVTVISYQQQQQRGWMQLQASQTILPESRFGQINPGFLADNLLNLKLKKQLRVHQHIFLHSIYAL